MKNKGFTLIELLAVILILGIIALIAIPTVTKTIDQSKKGAFEVTTNNIAKAATTKCHTSLIKGEVLTGKYDIVNGKIDGFDLEMQGKIPNNGTLLINDKCEVSIKIDDDSNTYVAVKNYEDESVTVTRKGEASSALENFNNTPIYENEDDSCFTYEDNSNGITITGYKFTNNSCSKDIVIPTRIGDKPVTLIKDFAFVDPESRLYKVYGVQFAPDIISVNKYDLSLNTSDPNDVMKYWLYYLIEGKNDSDTLYTCTDANDADISSAVNYIEYGNYNVCKVDRSSVSSPSETYKINSIDFSHATYLTKVPNGLAMNSGLSNITLGKNIKEIGASAFLYDNIRTINLENVETVGASAFAYNNLDSLNLKNVKNIGPLSFIGNNIEDINYGKVSNIEVEAFAYNNLQNINIPSTVTNISNFSFAMNVAINNVHISGSVKKIGRGAFNNKGSLNSIKTLTLDQGIETIDYRAFSGVGASSIEIPSSVKSIERAAFAGAGKLTSLILHEGLESIGMYAFNNASKLTKIVIPNSVTFVNSYAFNNTIVNNLTLGTGLTSINEHTFRMHNLKNLYIPDNVTYIADYAFDGRNNSLETLRISPNVTSIGARAFRKNKLTTLDIPDSVIVVDSKAFATSTYLKTINIGTGIVTIYPDAFEGVTGATFNINRAADAVPGFPWGATNSTVNWTGSE